jgi:hypothetical protein
MATTAIPEGAACFFCLEESGDDEGNSLVRDCSCRGNSGFAHLSCLAMYAEKKCRAASDGDLPSFREPWYKCTNCKQPFQNQVAIDLASAFVTFAEATYGQEGNSKWEKMKVMDSLRLKIEALNQLPDVDAGTQEELNNKLLSTIDQTKKDFKMNRWVHMPKASEEYHYYRALCNYEAYAYKQLGRIFLRDSSEEGSKIMLQHIKKARAIYNLVGLKEDAQEMDTIISVTAKQAAKNDGDASSSTSLEVMRNRYNDEVQTHGIDSEYTLQAGFLYALRLRVDSHWIEAEKLVTKLFTISRRVHGQDHKFTIKADKLLKKCKERYVIVLPDDKVFQALRYENDGEICVVTGPITQPRNVEDERIYHIENHCIIPDKGCPVICHGLVSASHLNGELGEVRSINHNETGFRLGVQFEYKGAKSALVKTENLRIAFELPSKD